MCVECAAVTWCACVLTRIAARKWEYYWMQETFSGLRTAEQKFMTAATYWEYMQDNALPGGLSGDITTFQTGHFFKCVRSAQSEARDALRGADASVAAAACLHFAFVRSLYVDPKEQHSALIRNLPFLDMYQRAAKTHAETFKRVPPKKVVSVARVSESQGTRRRAR